jgi:glucosylceramidase
VRIASTNRGDPTVSLTEDEERPGLKRVAVVESAQVLPNAAFRTPEGKIVLIVANDTQSAGSFAVQYDGEVANVRLSPGAGGDVRLVVSGSRLRKSKRQIEPPMNADERR